MSDALLNFPIEAIERMLSQPSRSVRMSPEMGLKTDAPIP